MLIPAVFEHRKQLAFDIYIWANGGQDYFNIRLFDLMAKADRFNFERLRQGFLVEASVFEEWKEDSKAFFEKYDLFSAGEEK